MDTFENDLESRVAVHMAECFDCRNTVQAASAMLEAVLSNLDTLIYVSDLQNYRILYANPKIRHVFGSIEGQLCWQVLQDNQAGPCSFCTNPLLVDQDGNPCPTVRWEFQNTRNGLWYSIVDSAIAWPDGRLVRLSMAVDITTIKDAESQSLAQQRALAVFEEREQLACKLHDGMGQTLGYINVQAQAVRDLIHKDEKDTAAQLLVRLVEVAQEAHRDLRGYIQCLKSETTSTRQDLFPALRDFCHHLHQVYGFEVSLNLPTSLAGILAASAVEANLYYIIQEALNNARRHSGADQASVTITFNETEVQVVVRDLGRGIVTNWANLEGDEDQHLGLGIMRKRAEHSGGSLHIETDVPSGTRLTALLPRNLSLDGQQTLRILLVDDHPLFLEGLRNLLTVHGMRVIGLAKDGVEAQELARKLQPDFILMDIKMPRCDGVEATRRIKAEMPEMKVVILTTSADDDNLFEALRSGACGYLLKDMEVDEFLSLLGELSRGETIFSPGLANKILQVFANHQARFAAAVETSQSLEVSSELTERQLAVLRLLSQGLTYKEIGRRLFLTERTIKYHMGEILHRLHLKGRRQVIDYVQRSGLT